MIKIRIFRDKENFIWKFTIKGHSGYSQRGADIVCAGVSAVAYTALGALSELVGIDNYTTEDGYMKCIIPNNVQEGSKQTIRIVLESMVIGLKQIENSYKKYVVIEEQEV